MGSHHHQEYQVIPPIESVFLKNIKMRIIFMHSMLIRWMMDDDWKKKTFGHVKKTIIHRNVNENWISIDIKTNKKKWQINPCDTHDKWF